MLIQQAIDELHQQGLYAIESKGLDIPEIRGAAELVDYGGEFEKFMVGDAFAIRFEDNVWIGIYSSGGVIYISSELSAVIRAVCNAFKMRVKLRKDDILIPTALWVLQDAGMIAFIEDENTIEVFQPKGKPTGMIDVEKFMLYHWNDETGDLVLSIQIEAGTWKIAEQNTTKVPSEGKHFSSLEEAINKILRSKGSVD